MSSCRPSLSLNPPLTSCPSSGVPLSSEPHDSERMVAEVAVGETRLSGDAAAADLVAPEVTVAMAVDSSREVTGASQDTSLALPLLPQPASSSVLLATDDVLQQFDATHRLSELTTTWGSFATFATSFGEKLQVSSSEILSLDARPYSSVLMSVLSLILCSPFLGIIPASFSRLKPRKSCLLRLVP